MKRKQQAKRDAKQLFRLCLVNGLLDESRVRRVVQLVSATQNRNRFALLAQFRRLVRLDRTQYTATVESATPQSPTTLGRRIQGQGSIHCGGNRMKRKFSSQNERAKIWETWDKEAETLDETQLGLQ